MPSASNETRAPDCDLLIVGGGPAGSSAACVAAKAGLRVIVLDKASFPRVKLCAGLVTSRSAKTLKAVFDLEPGDDIFVENRNLAFSEGGKVFVETLSQYPIWLTMRWDFDAMLLRRAVAAGAALREAVRIQSIDPQACAVTLADGAVIRGRYMIGADGVNSAVARALFGRAFDKDRIGFALEVEAPAGSGGQGGAIEIDFHAARWGYGWVFPKRKTDTIGIGGIQRHNADMPEAMARFLAARGLGPGDVKVKGHFLPFGDYRRAPGRGRVLLCGDAAGLVDPVTGEGIAYALQSGQVAAQSVIEAAGDPGIDLQAAYRARIAPIQRSIRMARLLRWVIMSPLIPERRRRALIANPSYQRRFMQLLAGEFEHSDIPRHLWRKLVRRLIRA